MTTLVNQFYKQTIVKENENKKLFSHTSPIFS